MSILIVFLALFLAAQTSKTFGLIKKKDKENNFGIAIVYFYLYSYFYQRCSEIIFADAYYLSYGYPGYFGYSYEYPLVEAFSYPYWGTGWGSWGYGNGWMNYGIWKKK